MILLKIFRVVFWKTEKNNSFNPGLKVRSYQENK